MRAIITLLLVGLVPFQCVDAITASISRMVVTFAEYDACKRWDESPSAATHCSKMEKCYGRRLVLEVTLCSAHDMGDEVLAQMFSGGSTILSVEDDAAVTAGSLDHSVEGGGDIFSSVYGSQHDNYSYQAAEYQNYSFHPFNMTGSNSTNARSEYASKQLSIYDPPIHGLQWNLDMVGVPEIWDAGSDGGNCIVAVLDSGVAESALPILSFSGIVDGYDFVSNADLSNDGDGRDSAPADPGDADALLCPTSSWHGTYVSSVLASRRFSAFSGIAYNSTILNVRVLGRCKTGYASDVADAIVWAVGGQINGLNNNPSPASVVSMSFSGRGKCPSFLQTAVDLAVKVHNATLYAAAGNDPSLEASDSFPSNCMGVVSVGSIDEHGMMTSYASSGASVYFPGGTTEKSVPCVGPSLHIKGCMGSSISVAHASGLRALNNVSSPRWINISLRSSLILDVPQMGVYTNPANNNSMIVSGSEILSWTTATGSYARTNGYYAENEDSYYYIDVANAYSHTISVFRCFCSGSRLLRCFWSPPNFCALNEVGCGSVSAATVYPSYARPYIRFQAGDLGQFSGCSTQSTWLSFSWTTECNSGFVILNQACMAGCSPGFYRTIGGCVACPAGTFHATGITTACSTCMQGTYSLAGASVCTACPENMYSNLTGAVDASLCQSCPTGKFAVPGSTVCMPCRSFVMDHAYSSMLLSSVCCGQTAAGQPGHGLAKIDSEQAWSAGVLDQSQWMQFDLGQMLVVSGVATQGRPPCCNQWVSKYRVRYSADAVNWAFANSGSEFTGNYEESNVMISGAFSNTLVARYVRIEPTAWSNHISIRGAVQVCLPEAGSSCPATSVINNEYSRIRVSSSYGNHAVGIGWNRGKLDSSTGWHPATADTNQWMDMNMAHVSMVAGIVTQGRGDGVDQWTTAYRVSVSMDGVTYTAVQNGASFPANADRNTRVTNMFATSVQARYVRVMPVSWSSHPVMRMAVLACVQTCTSSQYIASGAEPRCADCSVCSRGHFQSSPCNQTSDTQCRACPAGTISITNASLACTLCSAGSYSVSSGSTLCEACPAGTFSSVAASQGCTMCPAGTFSKANATICTFCGPGTFSSSSSSSACSNCAVGSYSDTQNSTGCQSCSSGFYSASNASTACLQCSPGTFSIGSFLTSCESCPAGSFSYGFASQGCTQCPMGTFSNRTTSQNCSSCAAGTYANQTGRTLCSPCLQCAGTMMPITFQACNATSDTICMSAVCGPGTYFISEYALNFVFNMLTISYCWLVFLEQVCMPMQLRGISAPTAQQEALPILPDLPPVRGVEQAHFLLLRE